MAEFRIQVRNLNVSLDGKPILRDISVDVRKGEIFTIIGPSGAGKSIFLRSLNRLLEPESGDILLDGTSIFSMDPRLVRKKVGMVFQIPIMFYGTVEDNILTGPRIWGEYHSASGVGGWPGQQGGGGSRKSIDQTQDTDPAVKNPGGMIEDILQSVDLPLYYGKRDGAKLSVGEQQRVCIGRAVANDPEVILMDEPTASLDPDATLKIETLIRKLNRDLGLTVVIVTHDMKQAKRIGDTTLLLEEGRVKQVGPTSSHFSDDDAQVQTRQIPQDSRVSGGILNG